MTRNINPDPTTKRPPPPPSPPKLQNFTNYTRIKMNKLDIDHMRQRLDMALTAYIHAFERKHDCEMGFAVCNDLMGTLCFGDNFFSMDNVIFDVENDLPANMIYEWQAAGVEAHFKDAATPQINLQSWHMGARYAKHT
jgi:hypothetical protein